MRKCLLSLGVAAGLLAGCAVVPEPPRHSLDALSVRQADDSRIPLGELVGIPTGKPGDPLPEGAIGRQDLGPALDWLAAHDADANGWLTTGELNAAWALLAAWAATGRPWSADSLVDLDGEPVTSVGFSDDDSRLLASRIAADPATGRLLTEARLRLALARDRRFSVQKLFFGGWH
jgi:hypothetical protein